jgi:hypothetical protein
MTIVREHNRIPLGALVLVRVPGSRRGLTRFLDALGRKPEYLYSFCFDGNFVWVNGEEFERVKKYSTRARVDQTKLLKCWNG